MIACKSTFNRPFPLTYEFWWCHWIYRAMRREQYNSGLHTLDSLAAIVSIAPDRTSNISKVLWTFFTSLNGSRMTLTFFRKSSKLFFKVPFQKSQNIKFSWHKKAKSGTNERFCLQTKTKQNTKWKNFKEFCKNFISDISTSLWPNQTK